MHTSIRQFAVIGLCYSSVHADFLLPIYPSPADIGSNTSLVAASWKNLSSTLDLFLQNKSLPVANVTFSLGMFSVHDPTATKLQYHYTAPEIANSKQGTKKVDADSIYRCASISKLITTYAGLVAMKPEDWNRPLSDITPGFANYVKANAQYLNPYYTTQWDKITPWALATQLSGVAVLGLPSADLATLLAGYLAQGQDIRQIYGVPPVDVNGLGACATTYLTTSPNEYCAAPDAIKAVANYTPILLPWSSPVYSDEGFMLLGVAISNTTKKSMSAVYQDSVFRPLGMTSSNDAHATGGAKLARSVVSGDPKLNFAVETGFSTPSGGVLTTINDLAKLGVAIMNNTQLSPEVTRKWMKPASHTATLNYSWGGPWEIHRYTHSTSGRITDLYTKLGDSGYYGGALVVIPQYDVGFSMLNAYSGESVRSVSALTILDYVTDAVLPALEAQAEAEAKLNYIGTYTSTDKNINASVTIAYNNTKFPFVTSGLSITEWTYNGTDVLAGRLLGGVPLRLELSIPKQTPTGTPGQAAFLAATDVAYNYPLPVSEVLGTWTGFYVSNPEVIFIDNLGRYGGVGKTLFVFDIDSHGKARACTPAVDRITLKRSA